MVGSGSNNTVLAELNQIDPIYVYFTISDSDLARLMKTTGGIPGQTDSKKWPVSVGLANEEGYPHPGYLDFAAISLTPTTGTLLMRAILSNPGRKILPGLYARIRLSVEKKPAFLLPEESIGFDQQGSHVLIVNEKNLVERRNIKTGPLVDNLRAVEEGLTGKEWVITKGLQRVAPGRQVTPEQIGMPSAPGPSQPARQNQGRS
jgi:RND family efflux transporter MFP subunit